MDVKASNIIPSGIEPVDKLLGGLESGQLYLVHGEASGKSLFGIKFLIEGLKRGENGALVIRYSPEDAVRRFARLGYDCLEDVYSGRLVILEYSDDIIQQIARLRELTPVLRELEWLLGETRPERLIYDPVTSLVASESGNLEPRVREFSEWARSFGATVVLIANGEKENKENVVDAFRPLVAESFRFEVKEAAERATRFIAFEKSSTIPDQAIEVDPSRGVFLLGRTNVHEHFFSVFSAPPPPSESVAMPREEVEEAPPVRPAPASSVDVEATASNPLADFDLDKILEPLSNRQTIDEASIASSFQAIDSATDYSAPIDKSEPAEPSATNREIATSPLDRNIESRAAQELAEHTLKASESFQQSNISSTTTDMFSDLFDELPLAASPSDLDLPVPEPARLQPQDKAPVSLSSDAQQQAAPGEIQTHTAPSPTAKTQTDAQHQSASEDRITAQPRKRTRASDQKIDSAIAARAVELLLRPPESELLVPLSGLPGATRQTAQAEPDVPINVQPKDYKVLIIVDDPNSFDLAAQTLAEYTVEVVHDGMSGLAKLIAFKPDLVVLDVDLPIIDGFKVLEHIRLSLNMPIIILSGSRVRASDRLLAAELGADYYLTKPFSVKELKHKARQLIARYRGISSWIVNARMSTRARAGNTDEDDRNPARLVEPMILSIGSEDDQFTPYQDFAAQVENRVKEAMDRGAAFSVVGCSLPGMTANGGQMALKLFELVRTLVRDTDLISTNPRNDLVVLLSDADASGARAFASRLRERTLEQIEQEPSIWMRSFPDLEEATEVTASAFKPANGNKRNRRASDTQAEEGAQKTAMRQEITNKPDSRESYIDFLEHL